MRLGWSVRSMVALAIGLGAGCFDASPEQERRDVCQAYCQCFVSAPQVESCIVDDCLPDVPAVSDACLQCVYANSQTCGDLVDDCTDLCVSQDTPLLGGS